MNSLGTRRPVIPMLTHVDNLGDLNLDMTSQEESLQSIDSTTQTIRSAANTTSSNSKLILIETQAINRDSSDIRNAVGNIADASTENTVIGLLKSIANKLS